MAEHPEYSEFCPHCGFKIASTHHYFVVKHNTRLSQQQCFSQNSSALSGSHSPTCSRSLPSPAPPPRSPTRSPFASQTVFRVKAVCALGHWVSVEHPGNADPVHAPAQVQLPPGGGISSPLHLTSLSHLRPYPVRLQSAPGLVQSQLPRTCFAVLVHFVSRVGGLLLLALCPHQHRHHSTFSPYLNQILAASRLCLWGPPLIFQHNNIINFNFLSRPGGLLLLSVLSQFDNVIYLLQCLFIVSMLPYFVFFRMSSMLWLTSECLAFLLYKFCLLQNVLRVCSAVLALMEEKTNANTGGTMPTTVYHLLCGKGRAPRVHWVLPPL